MYFLHFAFLHRNFYEEFEINVCLYKSLIKNIYVKIYIYIYIGLCVWKSTSFFEAFVFIPQSYTTFKTKVFTSTTTVLNLESRNYTPCFTHQYLDEDFVNY